MKHLLLICLAFSGLAASAKAARRPATPADTVTGHAQLVRKLSQALCTTLANDHTTAFSSLTPDQAMQLTQQLFTTAMQRDSVALLTMIAQATKQHMEPQQVGQLLGRDVVVSLSKTCPASLPLLARLSQTEQAQQAMGASRPNVSAAEKKVLQPLAAHICTQLEAANAKTPLTRQTPAQRDALFTSLLQKELAAGRPQLLKYYSAAQLADSARMEEIGQKIAFLMLAQNPCGQYMMLLGGDALEK